MSRTICASVAIFLSALAAASCSAEGEATTDAAQAGPQFSVQGEYAGTFKTADGDKKFGAQVIALGDDTVHGILLPGGLPGDGWEKPQDGKFETNAERETANGRTVAGVTLIDTPRWKGSITDGVMTVLDSGGQELGKLDRVVRESPTLGAKPPEGAIVLFDGSTPEHFENGRLTDDGLLIAGCISKQSFRDFTMHLEFRTPFMPAARGQGRGNSGMYLQNRYEVQVLDSFGLEGKNNECGGIYSVQDPRLNMCYPPLSWQTYDVEFTGARFNENGEKTGNAVVTLKHNGVAVYENFPLPNLTPGGADSEAPGEGPLQLQDHHNPVHYRNIWVVERK